jgi:uncharacterized protein
MSAENYEDLARRFLSILGHPDAEVVETVAVEDMIWTFPGTSSISGEARGAESIMRRARTIASYGVKVEFVRAVHGLIGVTMILHNTANRNGRNLDEQVAAVFGFRGDRISRLDTYLSDVEMAEAFFG